IQGTVAPQPLSRGEVRSQRGSRTVGAMTSGATGTGLSMEYLISQRHHRGGGARRGDLSAGIRMRAFGRRGVRGQYRAGGIGVAGAGACSPLGIGSRLIGDAVNAA